MLLPLVFSFCLRFTRAGIKGIYSYQLSVGRQTNRPIQVGAKNADPQILIPLYDLGVGKIKTAVATAGYNDHLRVYFF